MTSYDTAKMDNDVRGWIMTCLSAVACILGASVICVDLVVRLFPGKKRFRIQDSNGFLSCSLSLSAGVMLFSSLQNMLSSSKSALEEGGMAPKSAAWALIGSFLGGVIGIQILSYGMHHCMPSHVIDCDHTHDETHEGEGDTHDHPPGEGHEHASHHSQNRTRSSSIATKPRAIDETTPLLSMPATDSKSPLRNASPSSDMGNMQRPTTLRTRISEIVSGFKATCDASGPCFGYTDRCGQYCFKKINSGTGKRHGLHPLSKGLTRSTTHAEAEAFALEDEEAVLYAAQRELLRASKIAPSATSSPLAGKSSCSPSSSSLSGHGPSADAETETHHHHVPQNAFLSIGLQTSIAIALHKLPEGFITYATNHANPNLGFAVFLALFIHNISEGFALALPLYLAMGSRWKALIVSTVLGGISQPLGAAIAAVWLAAVERQRGDDAVSEAVYGAMFAVTAGIMASVALSLLQESFDLTHNKRLCSAFAFVGMGILGVSAALTA